MGDAGVGDAGTGHCGRWTLVVRRAMFLFLIFAELFGILSELTWLFSEMLRFVVSF